MATHPRQHDSRRDDEKGRPKKSRQYSSNNGRSRGMPSRVLRGVEKQHLVPDPNRNGTDKPQGDISKIRDHQCHDENEDRVDGFGNGRRKYRDQGRFPRKRQASNIGPLMDALARGVVVEKQRCIPCHRFCSPTCARRSNWAPPELAWMSCISLGRDHKVPCFTGVVLPQ